MAKRTFTTAKKKPEPEKSVPRIKPKGPAAAKPRSGVRKASGSTRTGMPKTGTRTNVPRTVAPPPKRNDNTKLFVIGGVVGAVILIMVLVVASSHKQPARQPSRQSQPVATTGKSTHERMMNQRYGGEMDGKTVQEWMAENGETEFAKERQTARKKR